MAMKRALVWMCACLVLACAVSVWAQSSNATISGAVTDPSGAVLPGVQLTLTSVETSSVAHATTGPDGNYTFPNLLPGTYNLTAASKGFKDFSQRGITVAMNEKGRVDVKMQLGAAEQTVEVSANASPLNYENAEHKEGISPAQLKELPLEVSGTVRSAANFATLMPGVNTGGGGNAFDARINGGLQSGDEAVLDGVSMQEGLMSQSGMVSAQTDFPTSPDMVSEVSILTSNYEPQYGSSTSGQVILETKSGTNDYHGGVFEYHRNTVLNARQFTDQPGFKRSSDLENEFGGFIGGPIIIPKIWGREKRSFFYMNLEGYRVAGGIQAPFFTVPTAKMRAGDFTELLTNDPHTNVNIYDPFDPLRRQFMGCDPTGAPQPNVICLDPAKQAVLNAGGLAGALPAGALASNQIANQFIQFLPNPTQPGLSNNFVGRARPEALLFHTNYFDIRGDQYFRDSDHFSVSIYYQGAAPNLVSSLSPQLDNNTYAQPEYAFVNRFNWDHTFSSTLLNHFAAGYLNRMEGYGSVNYKYANVLPQFPGVETHTYPPQIGLGDANYGYPQLGSNAGYSYGNVTARPSGVFNDLFTIVRDRHTIKIGGEYRILQENNRNLNNGGSGAFNFSSSETSNQLSQVTLSDGTQAPFQGNGFASFLIGAVDNASATFHAIGANYPRAKAIIWHVGDTWKVTPKLSFDYGIRYDYFSPSSEKFNNFSFLDPTRPNPGAPGYLGALVFAGDKSLNRGTSWGAAAFGKPYPERPWHKGFAPRVGIAYSLTNNTVARAGYGIFYTQAFYPGWGGGIAQDGFTYNAAFSSPDGGLTPQYTLNQGLSQVSVPPLPTVDETLLNGQGGPLYRPFDANRLSYAQQWNLTIEHQFTNNFYISTAYVGNKGTRLVSRVDPLNVLNPALLSLGSDLRQTFTGDTPVVGKLSGQTFNAPYPGWAASMSACNPTVAQSLLPMPQYCGQMFGLNENAGNSTYHSLQVKAEKRFSHGLWSLTSYTWEKQLDDADNTQADALTWNGVVGGVISKYEQHRNKSYAVDDVPQILSEALVYELPWGRGHRWANNLGALDKLVGGWELSSVFRVSSGIPLYFRNGGCNVPGQFAMVCIPANLAGKTPFAVPEGSFVPVEYIDSSGNVTRNSLFSASNFENASGYSVDPITNQVTVNAGHGPRMSNYRGYGYHNQDLTLMKNIKVTEKLNVQLRGEAFNVWNWHIFNCATQCWGGLAFNNNTASSTFGNWNEAVTNPRNVQLAARITW